MSKPLPYVRTLKLGTRGPAVEATKRAVYRYLKDDAKWQGFLQQRPEQKRRFGQFFRRDLIIFQHQQTAGHDGWLDEETLRALEPHFDLRARALWLEQFPPPSVIVYPYPLGEGGGICQGLHPTAGLSGNWAIDFCDRPGARVLAVEAGTIQKLSGHSPAADTWDAQGVFGWNTYIRTGRGYVYFVTHLGWQEPSLVVGSKVRAGEIIGRIGDQHFRPDHVHYGVSSPLGEKDAKAHITQVSLAPRVSVL